MDVWDQRYPWLSWIAMDAAISKFMDINDMNDNPLVAMDIYT